MVLILIETLPSPNVRVTVTARVTKLCPVKNERDDGLVTITYATEGRTFELHSLADYFSQFADRPISHEDFTATVAADLQVSVESAWETAGMKVVCEDAHVLR